MVWLPEGVGEKGFLESRSPTSRIDSSGKDMRRTGFDSTGRRRHKRALDERFPLSLFCYLDSLSIIHHQWTCVFWIDNRKERIVVVFFRTLNLHQKAIKLGAPTGAESSGRPPELIGNIREFTSPKDA
ncbi:hypothetical protein TNCV_5037531 [Trichonephila clavipes]|nr:hypothetical protein TNCV_5037531 [Trichonephila clavipes]